jgi:hypothetical protein
MPSGRLAALALAAALAVPTSASADGRPSGKSLWQAYPLKPTATATSAAGDRTDFGTSEPDLVVRAPAAPHGHAKPGGGVPLVPLGLAALALAGAAGFLVARRRRPPRPPASPPPDGPRLVPAGPPPHAAPATRTVERLRAAVDFRLAREWPWPEDTEGLWRCEIAPDAAALSARFAAVAHPPDGPPRELAAASATDSRSADPLRDAVERLAATLEADGWEAVDAGPARRFCWRHDEPPHALAEEAVWTARRG